VDVQALLNRSIQDLSEDDYERSDDSDDAEGDGLRGTGFLQQVMRRRAFDGQPGGGRDSDDFDEEEEQVDLDEVKKNWLEVEPEERIRVSLAAPGAWGLVAWERAWGRCASASDPAPRTAALPAPGAAPGLQA
jgi:hypothetical protein